MSHAVTPRQPALLRKRCVAALLVFAAVLFQFAPTPAYAGTLTGVFHAPYGADELYNTAPTERAPRDPMAGQAVQVKATTWPVSPGQTVWITWTKNGVNQTPVGAAFDYNSGNNTYWKVALGTFARGDKITYTVNADVDGANQKTSGPFSFAVTSYSGTGNVSGFVNNGTSVDVTTGDTAGSFTPKVRFAFPATDRFHVQVAPTGTGLNISGSTAYTVTDSATTLQLATTKVVVKIQKSPYRVAVYKGDGTTLIARQYDPAVFRNTGWASDGSTTVTKIEDHWLSPAAERFEGFGERYDALNQRGKDVHNYVYNQYQDQGPTGRTYLSVPFFTNSAGYGIYVPSTRYSVFNLGTHLSDMAGFTVDTGGALNATVDYHFFTGTRAEMLDQYTAVTARPKLPPKWSFGLWMSANEWNTQAEVNAELANVTSNNIPHSAMVLEQWADEATFYLWHGATYTPKPGSQALAYSDLTFPPGSAWSDPKAMVTAAHNQNIKMILWQIPVLKQDFDTNPPTAPQQHINDRDYAVAQGYVLGDGAGGPYRIPSGQWFGNSTVPDFTKTTATNWWMSKRSYLFDDIGIDGFKTDGSEAVFGRNVTSGSGRKGDELHNAYPNEYTRAYKNFVETKTSTQGVLFSRGGTAGAQANSIFWAGDQASTFDAFQQAVRAGQSAGQSGIPFWSWDLAGFTGTFPSSELYLRSTAQATFSPIMQYHSEKANPGVSEARTPWNVQARSGDTTVIPKFRKFANTRMNLIPYLYTEAKNASTTGLPMMQAMSVAYPGDATAAAQDQQYMFGRQLLVAPITTQGATSKNVYLPAGEWYDFWNGGRAQGAGTKVYSADTGTIPVYAKAGAIVPLNLNANYELGGTIGNSVDNYTNLAFRIYPSGTTSYGYFEDSANLTRTVTSTENFAAHQVTVSVPPLATKSTLQVASSKPTSVTKGGVAMTAHATLAALQAAAEGWYWDPVQQLTLVKTASAAAARTVVLNGVDKAAYEAEFGSNTGTTTNTDHPGYTGTGFVDGFETAGDAVQVDTHASATGSHVIKLRYANGAPTAATRTIQVDGVNVGSVNLPSTGNWDTWGTATLTINLTAGKRVLKVVHATGGINLDNITVARP
ncbi:glycoside hydrolase family 31 [Kribbella flavida DSM 17836]|uniref:Glycoside hydrolase family 31 n=1 Tax=Kribbella flavida (strain DSM 17836 / JCM 10339 / NBRC 14399) TaxID=479435 RepID=D2PSG3_KRIFD|nr:TIM-barrel domain-containing protein [Kribbella flavida]ADB33101.1 glycoside hydrolase family 31 [Kribbella flavida DSM 17836]